MGTTPRISAADLGDYADDICRIAVLAGIDRVGIAPAHPFERTRRVLEARRAAGLAGDMQFTFRNPARSTDPARIVPGARALVVGALSYPAGREARPPEGSPRASTAPASGTPASGTRATGAPDRPAGRVARYARDDHYGRLRDALGSVAEHLRADGWVARVVADDNALVDRAAARRAGIGWWGRNSNLLAPGIGSWFVLGSVVTDAPLPSTPAPVADGCGSCTRCLDGCPTGAIVAPGVVDARRCLAWLLQDRGPFPPEHRAALGDRLYGCDDCQEVCPHGRRGGAAGGDGRIDVVALLEADDDALLATVGRWYIPDRDPRYVRRNALVVLGNSGAGSRDDVRRVLRHYLDGDDGLLVEHAGWAAAQLGCEDLLDGSHPRVVAMGSEDR